MMDALVTGKYKLMEPSRLPLLRSTRLHRLVMSHSPLPLNCPLSEHPRLSRPL